MNITPRNPEWFERGVTAWERYVRSADLSGFTCRSVYVDPVTGQVWVEDDSAPNEKRASAAAAGAVLLRLWTEDVRALREFESRRRKLIAHISGVFDGVGREDGVTLHEADVIDDYGGREECEAARRLDTETRWQDVPDADIKRYWWIFSFLDPKGLRYYAPAYMVWSLIYRFTTDSSDSCSSAEEYLSSLDGKRGDFYRRKLHSTELEPADPKLLELIRLNDELADYRAERLKVFNRPQSEAIAAYLDFVADLCDDQAEDAVNRYWGQFIPGYKPRHRATEDFP